MHAEDRLQAILRKVRRHGSVRVTEAAAELRVSPVTVRKDVEALAERGLVIRVHGGARLPEDCVPPTARGTGTGAVPPQARGDLTFGMVVPSATYYYPEVIKAVREAAAARGARLLLRISEYDVDGERAQAHSMVEAGVDGLLLAPTTDTTDHTDPAWYEDLGIPLVLVERRPRPVGPAVEHVVTDHAYGARLAVHHLAAQGRRRIALLTRQGTPTAPLLEEGFRTGLRLAGLRAPEGVGHLDLGRDHPGTPRYDGTMERFLAAVAAGRVDAAVVHPDGDALVLLQRLSARSLTVPGDVAIVSYDDEVAGLGDLPLSAVAPSKHEVGVSAVELLAARVTAPDRPRRQVSILPELRVRASSGAR
ncbi:substrate-binding domain-containing protein [Streptomyces sparsogenes]|uniref:LacI family transcriptional regulator n=1 Tax=Streptomyces sparsogenes DSM 40356 TaxID=1331668 RepID=A0A1R1SB49_9ACTN|nr:substrate-binding domain-containing protein [Streptomyces sparsogenes]OMI35513.1 LacI family transcriptional regulator [Streptomyces sparsogenes DSM 40356]